MGKNLPSEIELFIQEEPSLARFRRALRREDQRALDDLFAKAQPNVAAVEYADQLTIMERMILTMLLEEHKEVVRLREQVQKIIERDGGDQLTDADRLF